MSFSILSSIKLLEVPMILPIWKELKSGFTLMKSTITLSRLSSGSGVESEISE